MNKKIFMHVVKNLQQTFKLERYREAVDDLSKDTLLDDLPWTPVRMEKFQDSMRSTFGVDDIVFEGTLEQITTDIDQKYQSRFWSEIWRPRTDQYQYSGWQIVEEITKQNPKAVLDVGCGYNQFKSRIPNLVGIDAYNDAADYMVDILDYNVESSSYDAVIVFGSINFGEYSDISCRFRKVFELTAPGGRIYVRANPGQTHKNGPWIDIFPWSFEDAHRIAKENAAELLTFKRDNSNRLFFVYAK
jgi:SAM-dependent methyltransferase